MKEFVDIYNLRIKNVQTFIKQSINKTGMTDILISKDFKPLFAAFKSLELIYIVDADTHEQVSPNIYRNTQDEAKQGSNRQYLLEMASQIDDDGYAFTEPYVSVATQNLCITVAKREDDKVLFFDFNLELLLEKVGFIERQAQFSNSIKFIYLLVGLFMMCLSLAAMVYAGIELFDSVVNESFSIHNIFKPIIAATLGLAIFDLSKTILEQEVFFKSYDINKTNELNLLTKFLATIIIALAIEALLLVFKLAIDHPEQMVNALYLLSGIALIIIALAALMWVTHQTRRHGISVSKDEL